MMVAYNYTKTSRFSITDLNSCESVCRTFCSKVNFFQMQIFIFLICCFTDGFEFFLFSVPDWNALLQHTLRHTVCCRVCCSVLCAGLERSVATHTATHCVLQSVLQCSLCRIGTLCCNVTFHLGAYKCHTATNATHCNTCNTLQHTHATHCTTYNTLHHMQHTHNAIHCTICNTLHHMQHTATHSYVWHDSFIR